MAYKNADYRPSARGRAILARAWEHLQAVPYRATSRWLFYRLLQDGYYAIKEKGDKKRAYDSFLGLTSRARHTEWGDWRPDTLADDTRRSIEHEAGFENVQEWVDALRERGGTPNLDHWYHQEQYVEVWFEAEAMAAQFEHYTRALTLRPFKGMPSIAYKFAMAEAIDGAAARYDLPVTILYFGDYDPAGVLIPETSVADIAKWCAAPFEFVRVGLNDGDGERLGIPENFDKPGTYQWEALPDGPAREMITGAVDPLVDRAVLDRLQLAARVAGAQLREYLQEFRLSA